MSAASATPRTWYDRTNYYEIVPARYLETMLWTHAERMARPVVDAAGVRERAQRRQGGAPPARPRPALRPAVQLRDRREQLRHLAPPPARRSAASSSSTPPTLEDARAFHEAYYGPGHRDPDHLGQFRPGAARRLGRFLFRRDPAPARPDPARHQGDGEAAHQPRARSPLMRPTCRCPWSRRPGGSRAARASRHGGDRGARRDPDQRRQFAASTRAWSATAASPPRPSSNLVDVEDGGYYAPYRDPRRRQDGRGGREPRWPPRSSGSRSQPVSAAELAEAKNELIAEALRQRETFSGRAFMLGEALVRTGDPRQSDKRLAGIGRGHRRRRPARRPHSIWRRTARVDIRYLDESKRPAGQADAWTNPVPMPTFASVPPATRPANALAEEGERQAPPAPGAEVPGHSAGDRRDEARQRPQRRHRAHRLGAARDDDSGGEGRRVDRSGRQGRAARDGRRPRHPGHHDPKRRARSPRRWNRSGRP